MPIVLNVDIIRHMIIQVKLSGGLGKTNPFIDFLFYFGWFKPMEETQIITDKFFKEETIEFCQITWCLQDLYCLLQRRHPNAKYTLSHLREIAGKIMKILNDRSTEEGWTIMDDALDCITDDVDCGCSAISDMTLTETDSRQYWVEDTYICTHGYTFTRKREYDEHGKQISYTFGRDE